MKNKTIITIDGPAGAGKSTIAKILAERIGFRYIDTGAMYRAITLKILRRNMEFTDTVGIEKLAEETDIRIDFENGSMKIYSDGEDVTEEIRKKEVTDNTSRVAAIPGVRYKLAKIQRQSADRLMKVVFEGRDMGSIVFPGADLKVYLDAGIQERASRRWQELREKGMDVDIEEIKLSIKKRDRLDESRGLAPLRVPENAHVLDSTDLSIEEVVNRIVALLDR
ncbi:MAG: (d)CMP kinase [Elusimicrobia bacterium]|nr:(d)CMP kinase [Elusimicrobiota bacterium]